MGMIPAFTYKSYSSTTASFTGTAIPLQYDAIDGCSFHLEYGQITGTFTFHASNDPRCMPTHPDNANADWKDITSAVTTLVNPSGSAGDQMITLDNVRFGFIRLDYAKSSDGVSPYLRVHFEGHGTSID